MSLQRRQLSNSKMKSDEDLFRFTKQDVEKKRPGSGQPITTIKSPLPPRKPVYSGQQRLLINNNNNIEHKQIKLNSNSSKGSLTTSTTQQQLLPQITTQKSPQKILKPPSHADKKLLMSKRETNANYIIKVPLSGEKQLRTNNSQQKVNSAGVNSKQFTWNESIEQPLSSRDNKGRIVSKEKYKIDLNQQLKVIPVTSSYQERPSVQQKVQLTQSVKQCQTNNPKCYNDFTMTSGRNDLQQAFAKIQMQIKEAAAQADHGPALNMSEIKEQNDDGCSSLAQSTLYQFNI